jgi:hypothetical protein
MRLFKRILFGFGAILLVLAIVVLVAEFVMHRNGSGRLQSQTAELDAADPGWRLTEITAARSAAKPPAEANSATVVLELHDRMPLWWKAHMQDEAGHHFSTLTNRTPSAKQLAWLKHRSDESAAFRTSARERLLRPEILTRTGGHYPVVLAENPFGTLLPHCQRLREAVGLIALTSRLDMIEGREQLAIRDARAVLVAARSLGDEPFLVSQLVRFACAKMAVAAALQTLAWKQPKDGLAELQAELLAEAEFNGLHAGLRGERGTVFATFEALRAGKIKLSEIGGDPSRGEGPGTAIGFQFYRGLMPGDQAKALELLTQAIEASKLPPHERMNALKAIPIPPGPPDEYRYLVTRLIMPAWSKVAESSIRFRGELLAGGVAIACERYRLANGRWPDSLDAIPKAILPEVPTDPFTGQPIQFRKLDDGIVVYCVGGETQPERLRARREAGDPLADFGVGAKLWNTDLRGLPPKPDEPKQ